MRYLLAAVLLAVSIPAMAADWKSMDQSDFSEVNLFVYIDMASIKEKSGHRLAWMKHTEVRKDDPTKKVWPNALLLMEFDCDGRWLMHKEYRANSSKTLLEEVPEKNVRREWLLILPDSPYETYEKVVCGK